MFSHRFKLVYMPEGRSKSKEYRFSPAKVYALVGTGILGMLIVVAALSALTITLFNDYRLQSLNRENDLLYRQIDQANERLLAMQSQIAQLTESDEELRLLADMPLIDEATRQAGIGGSLPAPGIDPIQDVQNLLEKLEMQISIQKQSFPEILRKMEENLDVAACTPAISPLDKIRLTSGFGWRRDPFTGRRTAHKGLDFGAERGTQVKATADGKVTLAKRVPTFGKVIIIDHGFGFETVYGHLNSFKIKLGESVKRGQQIGTVGNTGRSSGPHLHYEVRVNNKQVDPLDYVFDESITVIK